MRFLHAADLHIDSPLRGLDVRDSAPVERLRGATRRAAKAVVDLALQQQVDFVILAGDVFDGPWPDMRTGIWTSQQLARLGETPVYLLRGNHDAQSKVRQAVSWPANVREFSVEAPETFVLPGRRAALHGQGFSTPQVTADLAASYPPARPGMFNIGVLHTSLTGDPQHDTYAPTTEETLCSKGYDYWALGHIHQRRMVREHSPCIAYSGNTQGRHIRETGAKGCLLVEVEHGGPPQAAFHETDCLRWRRLELLLDRDDSVDDLHRRATDMFQAVLQEEDGRFVVARLVVRGACRAHAQLRDAAALHDAAFELRNRAAQQQQLWLEKIVWETSPAVDIRRIRRGQDLLGELLRDLDHVADDPDTLQQLAGVLGPLQQRAPSELREAGVSLDDPAQLSRWLRQAEGMLVSLLDDGGEAAEGGGR